MSTRVLVVDDSAFMRKVISDLINSGIGLEVCGTARDGKDAIEKVKKLQPDIVTMDIEMPELDGISALKEIMKFSKVPVIMVSAFTQEGSDRTLEAINNGAIDFVLKPSSLNDENIMSILKDELISKLNSISKAHVVKYQKHVIRSQSFNPTRKKILVIGSSTGGPQTLEALLTELPKNIPLPILIVQHMPPFFTKSLADRLNNLCEIEVREARDGDELKNGVALIAPGDFHMILKPLFDGHEGVIRLNQEPKEQGVRPCVNILFKSVAPIFKENTIGVILTGMGCDGTEGAHEIKNYKGTIIAQSEKTSIIYGMPKAVAEAGYVDEVWDIDKIPVGLLQLMEI